MSKKMIGEPVSCSQHGLHTKKKKKTKQNHANTTMTGSPCKECSLRCSVTVQAKTSVPKSAMGRGSVDGLSGIPVPFYCCNLLMLPRSGSFANLIYDDILGKISIDFFPWTIWVTCLPLLMTFQFCNGIENKHI